MTINTNNSTYTKLVVNGAELSNSNPLPTAATGGDASAANQTTEIGLLTDIRNAAQSITPVNTGEESGIIYINGVSYTVKRGFANPSSSGVNALQAGVTSKVLRVLSFAAIATSDVTITAYDTTPGAIGPAWPVGGASSQHGGLVLPLNQHGWFETATGKGFSLNLSAAVAVGVLFSWIEV